MPLSDAQIRAAKPTQKPWKLTDERGLYLLVNPTGSRLWRLKYRFHGIEKSISFGAYPDTSLALARQLRDQARAELATDVDPSAKRKAVKQTRADTFELIAKEWLGKQELAPSTLVQRQQWLDDYLLPALGKMPMRSIGFEHVLDVLRRIEARGTVDTALRVRTLFLRIFTYAVSTKRADLSANPAPLLQGAIKRRKVTHRAAIVDPLRVGRLLRDIGSYQGQPQVEAALKLAPLVFVRPGELRHAEWSEFDLTGKAPEWRIPAAKMKMATHHVVPLAKQAVALLQALAPFTADGRYLFPSVRGADRPISENTINLALRTMGYASHEMSGHGFRTVASTLLNEQDFAPDVIELQLSHQERDESRGSYNRAQRIPERRKMMQWWADHLDELRARAR